ncbi:CDP-diacylglycerol--glycerol-3-phosphate 3-phosphatidyltransferase [bacterium]|nr:CDP-diacylglycerol--glycerol-3-phosphate 3-phosphatidyltransferase [bacterium]
MSGFIKQHLPNWLTLGRILAVFLVIPAYYLTDGLWHYWLPWSIFAWACFTDFFDGYLARIWHSQSNLGKFLDPIADKLLITACILMLVGDGRAHVIPAIIIILREMFISGLREFLADKQVQVPVTFLAKVKTNVQMVAVGCIMVGDGAFDSWHVTDIGHILFWLAAAITLITGYQYARISWAQV